MSKIIDFGHADRKCSYLSGQSSDITIFMKTLTEPFGAQLPFDSYLVAATEKSESSLDVKENSLFLQLTCI